MVKKGDIYTTYRELAEKLGCHRETAVKWVLELEVMGLLRLSKKGREFIAINLIEDGELSTQTTSRQRRIVDPDDISHGELSTQTTIQPIPSSIEETNSGQDDTDRPPPEKLLDPSKNPKLELAKNADTTLPSARSTMPNKQKPTAIELELAERWLSFSESEMPWAEPPRAWNAHVFAKDIAKLKIASNLTNEGISAVLTFVSKDNFWARNALSPGGLLKRSSSTGVRKIDTILGQMKPESFRQKQKIADWDENYKNPFMS